jgi:DNA-binding NarL/FixJ family response regulator
MSSPIKTAKIKVIIADDHPVFRDGVKTALRSISFISKISQAANGEEVIKLLNHEPYDLVLMDIKMAPMDGIETTRIIVNRYAHTKVIALSMNDEEDAVLTMFENGASGYLLKNAGSDEIKDAIRDVVSGHQYLSKEISTILLDHINRKKLESPTPDDTLRHKQRIREIIFLISYELTTAEIAEELCLSVRTIDDYRNQIYKITNSKNPVGIAKYAMANSIDKDADLLRKFKRIIKT